MRFHNRAEQFEEFLGSSDYEKAGLLLHQTAEELEGVENIPDIRQRARVLETHRSLCDAIRHACNFATSFELSFKHREAMLKTNIGNGGNVASWLVQSIQLATSFQLNVADAAHAIRRIGSSLEGRCVVGECGGVGVLLAAWRKYPSSLPVVESLSVLCGGHVDNISRFAREDGIGYCTELLLNADIAMKMKEEILLLLGMCAICLPDAGCGEELVPSVLQLLDSCLSQEGGEKQESSAMVVNALSSLANVGEAAAREKYMQRDLGGDALPGYAVPDADLLVDTVLRAWESWRESWDVVSPAAHALCSMARASYIKEFTLDSKVRIEELLSDCRIHKGDSRAKVSSRSARALYNFIGSSSFTKLRSKRKRPRSREAATVPKPSKRRVVELAPRSRPRSRSCSPRNSTCRGSSDLEASTVAEDCISNTVEDSDSPTVEHQAPSSPLKEQPIIREHFTVPMTPGFRQKNTTVPNSQHDADIVEMESLTPVKGQGADCARGDKASSRVAQPRSTCFPATEVVTPAPRRCTRANPRHPVSYDYNSPSVGQGHA